MIFSFSSSPRLVFQTPPANREMAPSAPKGGGEAVDDREYRKRYDFTNNYLQSILDESIFTDVNLKDIDAAARQKLKEAATKALQEIDQKVEKPEIIDAHKDEGDFTRENLTLIEEIFDKYLGAIELKAEPKPEPSLADVLAADVEARERAKQEVLYRQALTYVLGEVYDTAPTMETREALTDRAAKALNSSTSERIQKIPPGSTFDIPTFNVEFRVTKNGSELWTADVVNKDQYDREMAYRRGKELDKGNEKTIVAMRDDGTPVRRGELSNTNTP